MNKDQLARAKTLEREIDNLVLVEYRLRKAKDIYFDVYRYGAAASSDQYSPSTMVVSVSMHDFSDLKDQMVVDMRSQAIEMLEQKRKELGDL